jgi:asparagine synthase (glutamine-hydrolysing)
MAIIRLTQNKAYAWHHKNGVYAKGYLFSLEGRLYKDSDLCDYFAGVQDESRFGEKLQSGNGIFSVVIDRGNFLLAAVDRIRYFPLFYRKKRGELYLGDAPDALYDSSECPEIDESAALAFSACSYVLGAKTLLKDCFQVQAGEYISLDNNYLTASFYYRWSTAIRSIDFEEAKIQFKEILDRVARRMAQVIGSSPVMLALSGGFDSRLVACLMKKAGIGDVVCYTFGVQANNPEWERSKMVAERLGYKWLFADYLAVEAPDYYREKRFVDFYHYVAQYVSKFGFMQYFAADRFVDVWKIRPDTIFFSGDGGDFFSGSHLRPYMKDYQSTATVAEDLQYTHCHLVQLNRKERKRIKNEIRQSLFPLPPLFANVENWDLKERQAKYIIHANKIWEYYGRKTQFPLCDTEIMDFFASLPFEYRLHQKLYKAVIADVFEECHVQFFPEDFKPVDPSMVQQLKVRIKRLFPFYRKRSDLYLYDYFDFKRFLPPVLEEMQREGHRRKILSSNGIFSEWYVWQVRKEINRKVR